MAVCKVRVAGLLAKTSLGSRVGSLAPSVSLLSADLLMGDLGTSARMETRKLLHMVEAQHLVRRRKHSWD